MRIMKFVLVFLLLAVMLASCNQDPNPQPTVPDETTTEPSTQPQQPSEEDSYPAPIKQLLAENKPYSLEFTSNGDGTCYVSKLYLNNQYKTAFDIIIPEKSPAGDTVTGIDLGDCLTAPQTTLPEYLTIERLKAFQTKVETDYPEKMSGEVGKWWINAYKILDISQVSSEQREEIVANYPLCEFLAFCSYLPKMSNTSDTLLRIEMADITPSLTRKCYEELIQEAREVGVPEELLAPYKALMKALPVYTNNSEQVRYLHIPSSVTNIAAESLSSLLIENTYDNKSPDKGVVLPVFDLTTTQAIRANLVGTIFSQSTSSVGYEEIDNFAIYSPEEPENDVLAWHYVDGVPTLWR